MCMMLLMAYRKPYECTNWFCSILVFSDGELKATFLKPLMLLVEDGHRDLQAANVK